jgi:hypothetical protein
MHLLPFDIDALKLSAHRDETGKLWFRLTDALELFQVSKGNVTFWAANIGEFLPESVCKQVYHSSRNRIHCIYVDLSGLLFFALRAESQMSNNCREWVVSRMRPLPEHGLDLGRPVVHEGKQWFLFARLVNLVVHHERGVPRQTVTTKIKSLPKMFARSLPQEDEQGHKLSKAGHVTADGVVWYLMHANTARANSYKREVAMALAETYEPRLVYLGYAA